MPNGYIDPMRVFTKLLKPILCYLREQGYSSVAYSSIVDDVLLEVDTYAECNDNLLPPILMFCNTSYKILICFLLKYYLFRVCYKC